MTDRQIQFRLRLLTAWAGATTLLLCAMVISGAASERNATFDVIDVERINVRKPDGRLSAVLSAEARMPGVIYQGREVNDREGVSGLLFYNGDGDETGALTWGSTRTDTSITTFGHLSFDGYEQDQTVVLAFDERYSHGERTSVAGGLRFIDRERPDDPGARYEAALQLRSEDAEERERGRTWFRENNRYGEDWANRVVVGSMDGVAFLALNDRQSRARVRASVGPDGEPRVELLDAEGEVVRSLTVDG